MLLLALVIISVSGCVISEKNKTGWDWEKYEKYSKFYDEIISSVGEVYGYNPKTIEEIDVLMVDMAGDTEFDKTWKLAFLYLKQGMEVEKTAYQYRLEYEEKAYRERSGGYEGPSPIPASRARAGSVPIEAKKHYSKSYEYRQKIDELNPITPNHTPKITGITLNAGQQNFRSIQAAIDAASPGDIVWISEGNYSGNITITKSRISIIGKNKEKVIIQNGGIKINPTGNVTVSGFTIRNGGISLDHAVNVTISGVIIQNEGDENHHFGISLYFANNNTIINTTVINKPVGIALSSSHNNTISGNDIKSSSRYGIHISQSDDNKIYSNNIQNNKVGIYEQINHGNKIFSNNFVANEDDGTWEILASPPEQKTFNNSIGMEFVQIPAGTFAMGEPLEIGTKYNDNVPSHLVNISKTFYMSKYEVTQKQWNDIMGNNPSFFRGDNLPVEQISWNDVQEFIKKLNEKEGTNKYRLPSEAEWEWASYSIQKLGEYAWYFENSDGKTHPVGQKKPNSKGLYDMIGNVWEWVQDSWHKSYFGSPSDGSVWDGNSSFRVVRGCSWKNFDDRCYSSKRGYENIETRNNYIGFRLVMDL